MFPFFSMLLQWSFFRWIKRIIPSEKWFNYVITFFFLENAKNLGRSDDAKQRKKRGWPSRNGISASLLTGKPWVQTPAGPALRVFK